jgi:hypothetical protein
MKEKNTYGSLKDKELSFAEEQLQMIKTLERPVLTYKLRAECKLDIHRLFEQITACEYTVKTIFCNDVEAEFATVLTLEEICSALRQVPDSHVMLETLAFKKDYTGQRKRGQK